MECGASADETQRNNSVIRVLVASPLYVSADKKDSVKGSKGLLATTLAIDIINNKTDGFFDDLLPNTSIVYEYYDTGKSVETASKLAIDAVSNAFDGEGADIVLGTASSDTSTIQHLY